MLPCYILDRHYYIHLHQAIYLGCESSWDSSTSSVGIITSRLCISVRNPNDWWIQVGNHVMELLRVAFYISIGINRSINMVLVASGFVEGNAL